MAGEKLKLFSNTYSTMLTSGLLDTINKGKNTKIMRIKSTQKIFLKMDSPKEFNI